MCDCLDKYCSDFISYVRPEGGLFIWAKLDDKIDILKEQLQINLAHIKKERGEDDPRNELRAILHTRRHLAASPIFKGIPNFRQMRIQMLRAETISELNDLLEQCRQLLKESGVA